MSEEAKLKKVLSLTDVMSVAFGQTVGAGVIVLTGVAIGMTGTGVVPAFILAAVVMLIASIPIAVLGSVLPATGGMYQYSSWLWTPKAGFFYLLLFIPSKMTLALYALSFSAYLKGLVPGISVPLVAVGILTVMYVANLLGVKAAANVLKFLLANLLLALFFYIVYGLPHVDFSVFAVDNWMPKGSGGFFGAAALLTFATGGAFFVSELGGEMKNPKRDIPLSIIVVTLIVGVIYALIGLVAAGVLPVAQVGGKPLSDVAKVIMPHGLFVYFIIGGALMSVAKMLLLAMTWGSKAILMGCIHGWLPQSLGSVSSRFGTPYKVLTVLYVIGLLPIIFNISIDNIAKLITGVMSVAYLLPISAAYNLPDKYPEKFKHAVFSIAPQKFKALVVVATILMAAQALLVFSRMDPQLVIGVGVYLAAVLGFLFFIPNRRVERPDDDAKEQVPA